MGQRLDSRERFPSGMEEYLSIYQWHFSKKMCQFACSKMKKRNPQTGREEQVEMMSHEKVKELLDKYNVKVDAEGYDCCYIANMVMSDYYKSSVPDEQHVALFVKDYFDDIDGCKDRAFTEFYAVCICKGVVINWEDVL